MQRLNGFGSISEVRQFPAAKVLRPQPVTTPCRDRPSPGWYKQKGLTCESKNYQLDYYCYHEQFCNTVIVCLTKLWIWIVFYSLWLICLILKPKQNFYITFAEKSKSSDNLMIAISAETWSSMKSLWTWISIGCIWKRNHKTT